MAASLSTELPTGSDVYRTPGKEPAARPRILERLFPNNVLIQVPPQGAAGTRSNLVETPASYTLQLSLPGADAASLDVQAVARRVIVKGRYSAPQVANGAFVWHDLPDGDFCDMFELPGEIVGDRAEAHYDRGILTIHLLKAAHNESASIPVHGV